MRLCLFLLIIFPAYILQAQPSIIILGTTQDAGSPQIGCTKDCCKNLFNQPDHSRQVVSVGLFDPNKKISYLFEATPDISKQLRLLKTYSKSPTDLPNGIFLTHAHIGHYTGLMYLGKEAMNAKQLPVYAMPKMKSFLEQNGPWSQLVTQQNILIKDLSFNQPLRLSDSLSVTPILVPHRDEYSETVGYLISGPRKKLLFIPDIDKWEKWNQDINTLIKQVDFALIDATFFDAAEINNRPISEIPHPFVVESMERFAVMPLKEKQKIHFIHFNHTNPLLNINSEASEQILKAGFKIAKQGLEFKL
ncbi:MAG TPA: MBL fold metallo-hydrolase [Sediminibacterium sp.]|uniref:MBL fold metallo-hydrolase n=1 Tax=Sediminibacterium sp. TaxID=1917865 RepID=UPI0008AAEB6B|nr:MBL fold metallo-hydrolase [Sediminibacterium sp.]OHC85682.1 MAG: pyrroloquinoline quinone biosynthesis protein PqqB [Sphingobacteriia bacterium RIFOXYC2_FULL_35_18]OHC87218.1 MAG: pyrroloquinoline quinone biosynthesis protein PqqB [Sphingobacteriia bacterium RIFOXYD2_FULL_35_12]HLD52676.1 MBL fold metallo-hydrolase [Sediminibacterium sp.]